MPSIFDPGALVGRMPRVGSGSQRHDEYPAVSAESRVERDWHLTHVWRFPGCLRWVTRVNVQGAPTVVVAGRHVEE